MNKHNSTPNELNSFDDDGLDKTLTALLYRQDCPDPLILGNYELGVLSAAERKEIKEHLAYCPHCEAELVQTAQFLGDDSIPMQSWINEALSWFEEKQGWLTETVRGVRYGLTHQGQIVVQLLKSNLSPATPTLATAKRGVDGNSPSPAPLTALTLQGGEGKDRFELKTEIYPDPMAPDFCNVQVKVYLRHRRRNLSGITVYLTAPTWPPYQATTDPNGFILFKQIPKAIINHLTIAIDPLNN